jgi:hypothetical protein
MIKRSLLALVLLAQGGCLSILDDSCGPEHRITTVEGEYREGSTLLVDATIELVEFRNGSSAVHDILFGPREARGAPLRDHVLSARLVHAGTGATLHDFPISPAPLNGDEIIGATTSAALDPDAVRDAFLEGDAVLHLETDLPGREHLVIPLPTVSAGDWGRNSCS